MTGRGPQELLQLLGGPGLRFGLLDRTEPRGTGDERHAAAQQPPAHGLVERAADDEMELVYRLWPPGPAAARSGEKLVVERLDVMVTEPSKPDPSEGRNDVAVHVALIAPVAAGREPELLAR